MNRITSLLAGGLASLVFLAGCTATTTDDASTTSVTGTVDATSATTSTAAEALAANTAGHDTDADHTWDTTTEVSIDLADPTATDGVSVADGVITITKAGAYRLSGSLAEGQVVVNTEDSGTVHLILDDASITNDDGPAIVITQATVTVIILADGTTNTLTDGSTYADTAEDAPNATLDSSADLTITGTGTLKVTGRYNDAISSADGLVISRATLEVDAADDGIRGKDYLVIDSGTITVTAGGDGLKSDNTEDAALGYISIGDATVTVAAGGDGISAATDVISTEGALTVTSGGGHTATLAADASAKALEGDVSVVVDGGTLALDAAEDGVNSNGAVSINGGSWTVAAGDDGVHADLALAVTGGTVEVTDSVEGLEAAALALSGGTIAVTASDDGVNGSTDSGEAALTISGGTLTVDALGDGIDVNGSITMTGGEVLVHGPTNQGNGSLDYDGTFLISGGTLVAAGSAGMAQAPSSDSNQKSLMANVSGSDGTVVEFTDADGTVVASFTGTRAFANVVVSTAAIEDGQTYTIVVDGTATGTTTTADAVSTGMGGGPRGGGGRRP